MRLIDMATERRVTIGMFIVAIILFGMVSLDRLSVTLLPDLNYPSITIRTELSGAAPEEIETLISKPIEEASGVIKNLKKIHSISRAGQSDVTLQFAWGTDMDFASIDVREKIDLLNIPLEASKPVLLRFDPSSEPIMRYALVSGEEDEVNSLKKLRRYADERLKSDLEAIEGTASVKISGGYEDEIHISVDQEKLSQLGLSIQAVADRLQADNINLSGGQIEEDSRRFQVRTVNEFTSLDDIRNTIVSLQDEQPVYLRDLAKVDMRFKQRKAIIRVNGKEAIDLAIYKEGDANTVQVAKRLKDRIERYKSLAELDAEAAEQEKKRLEAERLAAEKSQAGKAGKKSNLGPTRGRRGGRGRGQGDGGDQFKNFEKLPEHAELKLVQDQSRFISQAIDQVKNAALLGGLLAILVLYGFLRNARATMIIGLTIPVSVIGTFFLMYNMDLSLNIMSLGGIALAIGLLVDNSIVVLENIAQKREQGMDLIPAARAGTSQVAMAVTASTLTTVAVFFPMIFITGIAGQLFKDQALTVSFALIFSLIVALTMIPMLSSIGASKRFVENPLDLKETRLRKILSFLPVQTARLVRFLWTLLSRGLRIALTPMVWAFQGFYNAISAVYAPLLAWSIQHRLIIMSLSLITFIATLGLIPKLGTELIPQMSQGEFYADLHLSPGTPITSTDAIMQQLPGLFSDASMIKLSSSTAGTGNRLDAAPIDSGDNTGRFNVLLDPDHANNNQTVVVNELRMRLNQIPGLTYEFGQPELVSFSTPLEIEISGYDLASLGQASTRLIQMMTDMELFSDISSSIELGQPELQIIPDSEKAAQLGLSERAIADSVVNKVRGNVATRYSWRDRKIDVLIRSLDARDTSLEEISQLIINPESERPVTLASVAEIRENIGPASIHRIDQQRVALITASVINTDIGTAVDALNNALEQIQLPSGVSAIVKGQSEEMESAFASMQFALILAIFLVYLVMASQFESLIHPFVILFTIPMALIGAVLALYLTNTTINVVALIGLIMLAGIVVNNGIVLIDLINQLRAEGVARTEAILQAGKDRLRPILMTALTTVLGLLPMAIGIGEGSEIRAPMAITVIGGMIVATFLTLIVIPVVYSLLDRKQYV